MSVESALYGIKKLGLGLKFERACKELATAKGINPEDEAAMDAFMEETFQKPLEASFKEGVPPDKPSQLQAFRKAVGEEMWASIATNPSLPQLLNDWVKEEKGVLVAKLVDQFQDILKDTQMSEEDIQNFVYFQLADDPTQPKLVIPVNRPTMRPTGRKSKEELQAIREDSIRTVPHGDCPTFQLLESGKLVSIDGKYDFYFPQKHLFPPETGRGMTYITAYSY